MRDVRLVSLGRRSIVVGEQERREEMIRINRRLRGEWAPHRCTCATDHGWH